MLVLLLGGIYLIGIYQIILGSMKSERHIFEIRKIEYTIPLNHFEACDKNMGCDGRLPGLETSSVSVCCMTFGQVLNCVCSIPSFVKVT